MKLGADVVKKLVKEIGSKPTVELIKDLGADIVKNLSKDLRGQEIQQLIAKYGVDVVKWLGKALRGHLVKDILSRLTPDALTAIQDISGLEIKVLLDNFGDMIVNILAPALKGRGLQELGQLGMFIFDPVKDILLKAGQGAASSSLPSLTGQNKAHIESVLVVNRFTKSTSLRGMDVWTHVDGSVVRIKLSPPALKPPRIAAYLVKEISKNPGHFRARRDIFAKVADNGAVIPAGTNFAQDSLKQWFRRLVGRVPNVNEIKAMMRVWANAGHIDIIP